MVVNMLVIGSPDGNAGFVAARRCEANREYVDPVMLPPAIELASDQEDLPQHPMVLLRTYENLQMLMDPDYLRVIGAWMLDAADWLEDLIDRGE